MKGLLLAIGCIVNLGSAVISRDHDQRLIPPSSFLACVMHGAFKAVLIIVGAKDWFDGNVKGFMAA